MPFLSMARICARSSAEWRVRGLSVFKKIGFFMGQLASITFDPTYRHSCGMNRSASRWNRMQFKHLGRRMEIENKAIERRLVVLVPQNFRRREVLTSTKSRHARHILSFQELLKGVPGKLSAATQCGGAHVYDQTA